MRIGKFVLASAICGALSLASITRAGSIAVNFSGGSGATGGETCDPCNVTGTTGVVPNSTWNNISGITGTNVAINGDDGKSATLTYTAHNTWSDKLGDGASDQGNVLLNNYLDAGGTDLGKATITVSNVPYSTYNVILYTVGENSGNSDYSVNGVTQTVKTAPVPVPFVQDTATTAGNYLEFDGLTGPLTIVAGANSANFRSDLNGFQIVSAVPEPVSFGLLGVGALTLLARRRRA